MKRLKFFCLVLSIICFGVAGGAIVFNLIKNNNEKDISNNKVSYEEKVETINKLDKIGVNTNVKIINEYILCNHIIEEDVKIDKNLMNKTYEDILSMFNEYSIEKFSQNEVILKRQINEYCPYHYVLREENNKVSIYRQIDKNNEDLIEILNIDIGTLRQADRYMFKTTGISIYGENELYKLIEDYDS